MLRSNRRLVHREWEVERPTEGAVGALDSARLDVGAPIVHAPLPTTHERPRFDVDTQLAALHAGNVDEQNDLSVRLERVGSRRPARLDGLFDSDRGSLETLVQELVHSLLHALQLAKRAL